jgi:amidohydrolase
MEALNLNKLIDLRRHLHSRPEVSGNEAQTAEIVHAFLEHTRPDEILTGLGGHGILAVYGTDTAGPGIMFRAELDALPIGEINEFEYKSTYPGVGHKCGHDGHSTILCGLAEWLSNNRPLKGRAYLLFQPAEENGEGAEAVLADEHFPEKSIDRVFALHNLPGYPLAAVVTAKPSFTAAVNSIVFKLNGKTAHAAEPEHGFNPAAAMAEITQKALEINHNEPAEADFRLITPIYSTMGSRDYGISAGYGELHFTLRTWNDKLLRKFENQLLEYAKSIAEKHNLLLEHYFLQSFHANQNESSSVEAVEHAAKKLNKQTIRRDFPFKWGEDFGLFTAKYPGCMFGLGAGEYCPALHNPDYDFPESLIEPGIELFAEIASNYLSFE